MKNCSRIILLSIVEQRNKIMLILLLALSIITSGCATVSSIENHYAKIDYSDGINADEAKLIAKKQLIGSDDKYYYQIIAPYAIKDKRAREYPGLWFIEFYHKNPKAVTSRYLVVVNKTTGKISFSGMYFPGKTSSFNLILK